MLRSQTIVALLGEHKSNRLQCWALLFSELDYELKYMQRKNNGASDGLSHLPLELKSDENDNEYSCIDFVDGIIPIDLLKIKIETRKDTILSKVYRWIEEGQPENVELEFKGYFIRKVNKIQKNV